LVIAAAGLCLLSATAVTQAQDAPAVPDVTERLYLPLVALPSEPPAARLGVDFGNLIVADGVKEQDFPLVKQMGAQWNRIELPWINIEATRGVYTWDKYDAVMQRNAELGLKVLMLIHSSPDWAADEGCGPITDTAAFETFLAAAIARYGANVDAWEFMNEPDGRAPRPGYGPTIGCWAPYPEQYAAQLGLFYNKVKELDPTARVMFGSLAYDSWAYFDREFLNNALSYGAGRYFDVLGLHHYPFNLVEFPTPTVKLNEVQATMNAHLLWNKEIWITETSMWSNGIDGLEGQRNYVIRDQTQALCSGASNLFWFAVRQEGDPAKVPLHRWLISIDHRPDQSYGTYQRYSAKVSGMTCRGAYAAVPAGVEAYHFNNAAGAQLYVLWSTDNKDHLMQLPAPTTVTVTERGGEVSQAEPLNGVVTVNVTRQGIYVTFNQP
jgi:hypothetical protein